MSSRQLRKLQQQRELEESKLREQNSAPDGSEEGSESDEVHAPVTKQSLFANLAALQDPDEGEDEEGDPEEADEKVTTSSNIDTEEPCQ